MEIINTNFKYNGKLTQLNIDNIRYIVLHHTGCISATPEEIHKWHLNKGWLGFGYNEYIRKDGTVYIGRGYHVGAHCLHHNFDSYGICCEGNYEKEKDIPNKQYVALIERLRMHIKKIKNVKIVQHKYLAETVCPGNNFPILKILEEVEKEHWGKKIKDELVKNGIIIHEERFDDKITRAESFALIYQMLNYVNEKIK